MTTYLDPTLTKVGIVYGAVSGQVRRHIYPSQGDSGFDAHVNSLLPGEAICYVPITDHLAGHDTFHASIRNAVQVAGGVPAVLFPGDPGALMFARVDPNTNTVDHIIMADPNIPSDVVVFAKDNWIQHQFGQAVLGATYNPLTKVFTLPISTTVKGTV